MTDEEMEDYTPRLQRIEKQIRRRILTGKKNVYELGKLLCEAKKWMRGSDENFLPWVKEKFSHEFSYQSANLYMSVYSHFKDHPDLVEKIPLTYLMELIREYPGDEIIDKVDKILKTQGFQGIKELHEELKAKKEKPEFDKIIEKYKKEDHVKYYQWLTKEIVNRMRYARSVKTRFGNFSELIGGLYNEGFPFQPDKTLDVLKKVEAEGFIQEIEKARAILDETQESFVKALNDFSNN